MQKHSDFEKFVKTKKEIVKINKRQANTSALQCHKL